MAIMLPAQQIDYSGIQRAAAQIGASYDAQRRLEQEQAFRMKLLQEQFDRQTAMAKQQHAYRLEEADHQEALKALEFASTTKYKSDLSSRVEQVMRDKALRGTQSMDKSQPRQSMQAPGAPTQTGGPGTPSVSGESATGAGAAPYQKSTSPGIFQDQSPDDTFTVYMQGKPIEYTRKELEMQGEAQGFWDVDKNRYVTFDEQHQRQQSELFANQVAASAALEKQRKSSMRAEDLRGDLIRAQTTLANLDIQAKARIIQQDKTAKDSRDAIAGYTLANILTNNKFNDMSQAERDSMLATLRAKDDKSDDPAKRTSQLDKFEYFYNPQAIAARDKYWADNAPKVVNELTVPEPGQTQYKAPSGWVDTARYFYDTMGKKYIQAGDYASLQKLPQAVSEAMKMYTMNGAMPIELTKYQATEGGAYKLQLTDSGAKVVTAVQSLMRGDFNLPDPPMKDDERGVWERQAAAIRDADLAAKPGDSQKVTESKFAGMYKALTYYYTAAGRQDSTDPLPRTDKVSALAATLIGISPERVSNLISNFAQDIQKDSSILGDSDAYASEYKSRFMPAISTTNKTFTYNLPNTPKLVSSQFSGQYYPEYFSEVPKGQVPDEQETRARMILGGLINNYMHDNSVYVPPGKLQGDLKRYGLGYNTPIFQQLLKEYEARYNSKTLPSMSK